MSEETTNTPEAKPARKAATKSAARKPAAKTAAKKTPAKKATTARASVKKPAAAKTAAKAGQKATAAKPAAAKKPAAPKTASKPTATAKAESVADEQERIAEAADKPESTDTAARAGDATGHDNHSNQGGFDAEQFKQAMKEKDWGSHLKRLAMVALFSIFGYISLLALIVLAVCQLVLTVLNDSPNETVRSAMTILGRYISDIMDFLSFQSDEAPFPLGKDLPSDD